MIWLALPVFVWDLSVDGAGLVAEGDTLQWAWSAAPEDGPGPADPAWGTTPDGRYLNDADDSLRIDLPDLSGTTDPYLLIDQWVAVRPDDRAIVEIDSGGGFAQVEPVGGYPSADGFSGTGAAAAAWNTEAIPLPTVSGAVVRLRLDANLVLVDDGWYVRALEVVDGDVVPPVVAPWLSPADTQDLVGPYPVEVEASDDNGLVEVLLHARYDGVDQPPVAMTNVGVDRFRGELPAVPLAASTTVVWWVEASDGEQVGRYPESGEEAFDVFLAAPTGVEVDVDGRFVGQQIPLAWTPPDSPNDVVGYEVGPVVDLPGCDDVDQAPLSVTDPEATWPAMAGAEECVEVRARYDVPSRGEVLGAASEVLPLDAEVPELLGLEPARGFAGASQWVEIRGVSLYLDPSRPPGFGQDATVDEWEVLDAHRGRLRLSWASDATVGPVDLSVYGQHGDVVFPDAFTVDDAANGPRIVSVTPTTVTQGDEVDLLVEASVALGAEVTLEASNDIFLTAAATVDGSTLTLPVSVSTRARLGDRTLLVDDGENLWTVDLTVEEYRPPVQKRCATSLAAASGLGWCVVLVGLWRRRRPREPLGG